MADASVVPIPAKRNAVLAAFNLGVDLGCGGLRSGSNRLLFVRENVFF